MNTQLCHRDTESSSFQPRYNIRHKMPFTFKEYEREEGPQLPPAPYIYVLASCSFFSFSFVVQNPTSLPTSTKGTNNDSRPSFFSQTLIDDLKSYSFQTVQVMVLGTWKPIRHISLLPRYRVVELIIFSIKYLISLLTLQSVIKSYNLVIVSVTSM